MSITESRSARVRQIRSRLDALKTAAARTMWEFGTLFAEVKRDELWRDDGADTFRAWLERVGFERETARKAMLVAANFTYETATLYGHEKLVAAVEYIDATKKEEAPGELGALQVRYPGKGGKFETVPFPEATVAQMKAATKLVTGAQPERARPDEVVRYDDRVARLLEVMPAAPAGLKPAKRVQVAVGTDGRPAVTFHAVPLDELEAFFEAVRTTMLDGSP